MSDVSSELEDKAIERAIRKHDAWGHVAIWYVSAVINSFIENGLWLNFRKNGVLNRSRAVGRVVADLYVAMYGKELTKDILKNDYGWKG